MQHDRMHGDSRKSKQHGTSAGREPAHSDRAAGDGPMSMEHGMMRGESRMSMQHDMTAAQRRQMTIDHHKATIWLPVAVMCFGLWLAITPALFQYRSSPHAWLDALVGIVGLGLGFIWMLHPLRYLAQWAIATLGLWLLFAPLVFRGGPAEYASDTFIGVLFIVLPMLISEMPGMMMVMKAGPQVPPGWSYNPSSWLQRAPIIAIAAISFFASRYLAAFQLGHVEHAWDPFFTEGTRRVLTSEVSRAWPISDGGLGSIAYALEVLMGFMGGQDRWRTMPWMVALFGILVVPLGVTSIVLIILQPVSVGAWCTICLFTALLMLIMIPLTLDEVWAMGEFLVRSKRSGKPVWRTFFLGDTIEGGAKEDTRLPAFGSPVVRFGAAMTWGVTLPWNFIASAVLGVWLMFAPAVFGTTGAAADADHLLGALVVTGSVILLGEVARPFRWLNSLLGIAIAAAPIVVSGGFASIANDALIGLLVVLLNLRRGGISERYGLWNPYLGLPDDAPEAEKSAA